MTAAFHILAHLGLWIIPLGFLIWWLFRLPGRFRALDIMQTAPAGIGRVVEVSHTKNYRYANSKLLTTITLDVVLGGPQGRVKTMRVCTLDAMPRVGDLMVFRFDPRKRGQAFTSPFSAGAQAPKLAPISPETLRDLAVATIVSVSPPAGGKRVVGLEIDAIGAPKRRVKTAPLTNADIRALKKGWTLTLGDRVFVRPDPRDLGKVDILPPAMTGGADLASDGDRLDSLVLGPQLLRVGAKAMATVRSATSIAFQPRGLHGPNASKWRLDLDVRPEHGAPFTAQLETTLSTPEKALRMACPGAERAIRYDPYDLKTLSIDSVAMGYEDPYAAYRQ